MTVTSPSFRRKQTGLLIGLLLAAGAVTAAVHWPVLSAQALSLDDQEFLTDNSLVRTPSWASARRFLTEVLEPSTVRGYYLPLSMISLMLDCRAGGAPGNLYPFHRTSLALHVANTLLVVVLLYLLFGEAVPAAMLGLLFGVHPLTVEPVAWVGERKTLLAAFFALLGLLAYVRHARGGGRGWLVAAVVAYLLALMSKPTAAPLPFMLVVLDWWPLQRLDRRAWLEKVPFLLVGGVFAVITMVSHARTAGLVGPGESARGPLVACYLLAFYLGKMIWPVRLSSIYVLPEPMLPANPAVLAAMVTTAGLAAVVGFSLKRTRAVAAGSLIFLVALLPTMGIVQYSWITASDKYLYLPVVGLLLTLGWALCRASGRAAPAGGWPGVLTIAVGLSAVGGAAIATRGYLPHWNTSIEHARYLLDRAPGSAEAHNHLGQALAAEGRLDPALEHWRRALQIRPGYPDAVYNLGAGLRLKGRNEEAIPLLEQAVEANPANVHAVYFLGLALQARGRLDEASARFRRTIELRPAYAFAHYSLGQALRASNRPGEAEPHLRRAVELKPDYAEAHNDLGTLLLGLGRPDEAMAHFERAVAIDPRYVDARSNLGSMLARGGRVDEAIAQFNQALAVDAACPEARYNLGLALQMQSRDREAADAFRRALEDRPDYAEAHNALGALLSGQGKLSEALAHFQEALRLRPGWITPLNAAAWILATHPDPAVRRPGQALQLAEQAAAVARGRSPGVLDTLAAAQAANGAFDRAAAVAEEARQKALAAGDARLAGEIAGRAALYRRGEAFREPASRPSGR